MNIFDYIEQMTHKDAISLSIVETRPFQFPITVEGILHGNN